jgi:hypothetical protein
MTCICMHIYICLFIHSYLCTYVPLYAQNSYSCIYVYDYRCNTTWVTLITNGSCLSPIYGASDGKDTKQIFKKVQKLCTSILSYLNRPLLLLAYTKKHCVNLYSLCVRWNILKKFAENERVYSSLYNGISRLPYDLNLRHFLFSFTLPDKVRY